MKRLTEKLLWEAYGRAARWGNKKFGRTIEWRRELAPAHIMPIFRRAVRELFKLAKKQKS